ncbi:TetR/AcrR family transcriptional regulator [Nocardia yamanashiensis]|uniref:TetR/AcrR family transcriptional regulator n=1 Tax=Nocardia yamanashiensis TaxID=209247 RepID=UPI00082EB4F3|nr:TetR/AcrR family transcriptional regulator [Nocardia yamanashiensis]
MTPPGTRAPQGERAERKRQAILESAREIFLTDGYAAGIDAIAAAANVSKVTIYNHFGSKEELFVAVVGDALREALADAHAAAEQSVGKGAHARECLTRMARAWVRGLTDPAVTSLRRLVVAERNRFPQLAEAWEAAGPGASQPILVKAFEALSERGDLEIPDVDLAIVQFYSLVLYPHLVRDAYRTGLSKAMTDKLIVNGVDMLVGHYAPRA